MIISERFMDLRTEQLLQQTLFEYTNTIRFQKREEIELVANKLLEAFAIPLTLTRETFKAKIVDLSQIASLSEPTNRLLSDCLEMMWEIFEDPLSYLGIQSNDASNSLITSPTVARVHYLVQSQLNKFATSLSQLKVQDQMSLLEEKKVERSDNLKRKRAFNHLEEKTAHKTKGRSSVTRLNYDQNSLKNAIFSRYQIELFDERDNTLEIHEDLKTVFKLWKEDPSFFEIFAELLFLNFGNISLAASLGLDPAIWARFVNIQNQGDLLILLQKTDLAIYARHFPLPLSIPDSVVFLRLNSHPRDLTYFSDNIKNDPRYVLYAVLRDGRALQYASQELRCDQNIVKAAIANCGQALAFAEKRFQDDFEIVFRALESDHSSLLFASKRLQKNADLQSKAAKQAEIILKSDLIAGDTDKKNILMALFTPFIAELKDGKIRWHSDVELIIDLHRKNGNFFSENRELLFKDFRIVFLACRLGIDPKIWSPYVGHNENKIFFIINENFQASAHLHIENVKSPSLLKRLIKFNAAYLQKASPELLNNHQFLLEAVAINGRAIAYTSLQNRQNPRLGFEAFKKYPLALAFFQFSPTEEQNCKILEQYPDLLPIMGDGVCSSLNCVGRAVAQQPKLFKYASRTIRADRHKTLCAINFNPAVMEHIDEVFLNDPDFIYEAMRQNARCTSRVSNVSNAIDDPDLAALIVNDQILRIADPLLKSEEVVIEWAQNFKAICSTASERFKGDSRLLNKALIMSKSIWENDFINLSVKLKWETKKALEKICTSILTYASPILLKKREFVLKTIQISFTCLGYADQNLLSNREFAKEVLMSEDGCCLKYFCDELRNDREIVLTALSKISYCSKPFKYASEELRNDREIVLAALSRDTMTLEYASEELRNNREIVLAAVSKGGSGLKYASEELCNDREIVLKALSEEPRIFKFASEELRNNREFILEIISKYGAYIEGASEELCNDREIVLKALSRSGMNLKFASEELRDDREIVLKAVSHHGFCFEYASENLRNDREMVLAAVQKSGRSLLYASDELRNDRELVLNAVSKDGTSLSYASKELRKDREIVLKAASHHGFSLIDASEELRNDREIVLKAVSSNGMHLANASEELRNDREIVLKAITESALSLQYASEELRNDREIVLKAIIRSADSLEYASEELRNNREFVLSAIQKNRTTIVYADRN